MAYSAESTPALPPVAYGRAAQLSRRQGRARLRADVPPAAGFGTKRKAFAGSPRVLLLFSALIVMMFSLGTRGHTFVNVAAFIVAAIATGVALLRPTAMPHGCWQRRWEWMIAGLILVAAVLRPVLADLGFPLSVTVTVLAMAAISGLT